MAKNLKNKEQMNKELVFPTVGQRIFARLIDIFFIVIIFYVSAQFSQSGSIKLPMFLALYISSLLVFFLCNLVLMVNNGQTIGKKLTDIKVITKENKVPPVWKIIFIRELFFYSGITLLMMFNGIDFAFFPDGQYIPDRIGGTLVVLDKVSKN